MIVLVVLVIEVVVVVVVVVVVELLLLDVDPLLELARDIVVVVSEEDGLEQRRRGCRRERSW